MNTAALALFAAYTGGLAVSAIFLYGAWRLIRRNASLRDFIAQAKDLVRSRSFPDSLARSASNPVLPTTLHSWEAEAVMNPAVVDHDGRVHLFYRAIGSDGVSRIGYASSADGISFDDRLPYPVFATQTDMRDESRMHAPDARTAALAASGGSWSGVEDPRAVLIEDRLYLTFNSFRDWSMRIGLSSLSAEDLRAKKWNWKRPSYLSPPGQVHKNWLVFPRKINGKFAVLHSVSPKPEIAFVDDLHAVGLEEPFIQSTESPRVAGVDGGWEKRVRGVGPPPIETKEGWLVLYHAHDEDGARYKVGAMILGLDDPTKVIARAKAPVLEPEGKFENEGAKPGIVYATGAIVRDGMLIVYYGGADNVVCMGAAPLEAFVKSILRGTDARLEPIIPGQYFAKSGTVSKGAAK